MTVETAISSLGGGALIGLAASTMMLLSGRVAGISGIYGGLLRPVPSDIGWRLAFVLGLVGAGVVATLLAPEAIAAPHGRPLLAVALAGGLVGFGVRMGNGCTSGHGVCGLSRLSVRSLVATLTFMTTGALSAVAASALLGGGP
jgi:uncharacterized membrane protein YedE/YeeE